MTDLEREAGAEGLAGFEKLNEAEKRWLALPDETREKIRRQSPGLASFFASVRQ